MASFKYALGTNLPFSKSIQRKDNSSSLHFKHYSFLNNNDNNNNNNSNSISISNSNSNNLFLNQKRSFETGVRRFHQKVKHKMATTARVTDSSVSVSSSEFESSIFLKESEAEVDSAVSELALEALVWAAQHGLLMGDPNAKNSGIIPGVGMFHAPISLFPSPFPRHLYEYAIKVCTPFNLMADAVSSDAEFLQTTLASAAQSDEFTASLLRIHKQVENENQKQNIQLSILRSDYMIDTATHSLLQIELNTISSALAGLASLVSSLHSFIIQKGEKLINLKTENVLPNDAISKIANAMYIAWKEYNNKESIILMVVQDSERNMYDQFALTSLLWSTYKLTVVRKTFDQIYTQSNLTADRTLIIDDKVVSIIYFRAGYGPNDYRNESDWQCRLMMERSNAVKCPTVSWQLAGSKKVQQELAKPGVLERFVHDSESAILLRQCFAGLWSLEIEKGEGEGEGSSIKMIKKAMESPDLFVLKPQREGGGNNVYGKDVKTKLEDFLKRDDVAGLAAYILMQRIFPPAQFSYLVRDGVVNHTQTISELGIFGSFVRNGDKVIHNELCGHVLRTKDASSDEGGVASGFSVLDSPYLI